MTNVTRVATNFGTRPEAIKLAPAIQELARSSEGLISRVVVTAQHRQMLDQVLDLFDIVPEYDIDIVTDRQSLSGVVVRALTRLESILPVRCR